MIDESRRESGRYRKREEIVGREIERRERED